MTSTGDNSISCGGDAMDRMVSTGGDVMDRVTSTVGEVTVMNLVGLTDAYRVVTNASVQPPGCPCEEDDSSDIFHLILLITLTSFCLVSNSLVITVIVKEPRLQSPLNYFILNLALSDLLHGLAFMVYNMSHLKIAQATMGVWGICCFLLIVITTAQMASSFNLVGITGVRYIMVKEPLKCRAMLSQPRMRFGVITVWLISAILAISCYARPQPSVYCGVCRTELFWEVHNISLMIGFTVIVPLILMAVLYCKLHSAYTEHSKKMSRYTTRKEQEERRKSKSLSRVALLLVFYFAISYLPFTIYVLTYMFCDCYISPYIRILARMTYFSNTTVNFFIYMYRYTDFRIALIKLCCCCRPRSSSSSLGRRDDHAAVVASSNNLLDYNSSSLSSLQQMALDECSNHEGRPNTAAVFDGEVIEEHSSTVFYLEE